MVRITVVKLTGTVCEKQQTFIGDYSWCSRKKVCNSYILRWIKIYIRLEVNWGRLMRSLSSQAGTSSSPMCCCSHTLQSLGFADALSSAPALLPLYHMIKLLVEGKLDQYWAYLKIHTKCSSVVILECR